MNERTLRVLEFDKIIAMLAARAHFSAGRALCEQLVPLGDLDSVLRAQAETSEAQAALRLHTSVPFGGIPDVRELADRAAVGAVLGPEDLLSVAETIAGARRVKKFVQDLGAGFPLLSEIARGIIVLGELESSVRRAITDAGTVSDEASPELLRIRRALRVTQSRIRERLEALVRSPEASKYLQEPIVTMRNGRFVVPVREEHKSLVPGIVHDQSSSGATLFIEPMVSVDANNELRRLELQERDEIERILTDLSRMVGAQRDEIHDTVLALAHLDFAFAKGRLSLDMDASQPNVTQDSKIDLRVARHPLLRGEVVPVDVRLGIDFDTLVITGPNTGGKTVTLKTIGLLVLMTQAGLHVPASGRSRVSVFKKVFCDIGDEQSIEQSLSTFSSHMRSIVEIVDQAGEGSLVLIDEIGAGTDPDEGSALAMALLEYFHAQGAKTVATTHYSELKSFAYLKDRVENASVEFDVETLRPTFRLSIGLPGRSNAFEISRRLGLKESIIQRAREMLSDEHLEVERLIGEIQSAKFHADEEKRKACQLSARAEELKSEYSEKMRELKRREREILERARQEAQSVIARVKAECEEALKRARQAAQRPQNLSNLQREVNEALRRARSAVGEVSEALEEEQPHGDPLGPGDVCPGDYVFIKSLGQKGLVISGPDQSGSITVQVGILRTQVRLSDAFRAVPEEQKVARENLGRMMAAKAETLPSEIMLLGLTTEEALDKLEKYLDDAMIAGLKQVRIVHGKGTGTLRKAVHEYLRSHRSVVSYRLGGQGEGGDGVTVAVLEE